ncbi:MAG: TRAP transporter large permease subunit [Mailhella sp.]|nr:TRAP transporter large permease subunit [Mailhella sp.]
MQQVENSQQYWTGQGLLKPKDFLEAGYNKLADILIPIASLLLIAITIFITIDVCGRTFFDLPVHGITDLETAFVSAVGFLAIAYPVAKRESMCVDLIYGLFSPKTQRVFFTLAAILGAGICFVLAWRACVTVPRWNRTTEILDIPQWPSLLLSGLGLGFTGLAFFFQLRHSFMDMIRRREIFGLIAAFVLAAIVAYLPFAYKHFELEWTGLTVGLLGWAILMVLMLLKVPLGYCMALIGVLGLIAFSRTPMAALKTVAAIPYTQTATFMMIAFPMYILMGEMVGLSGMSDDLFDAAKKCLGHMRGGLAIAAVGGCAGFGAVCGESMATIITMSAVAMPAMRASGYSPLISCGALASGGTLGILIPPSMGFIVYSMITEQSVGKLFVSGILPGILLSVIFMIIIYLKVRRNPELAPAGPRYGAKDRIVALSKLLPVIFLFVVVVFGILNGLFTPAEGGALGSVIAMVIAVLRRKLTVKTFGHLLYRSSHLFGKMFPMLVGLNVLASFLATSRLPNLLADAVMSLDVNRYVILACIILFYIVLGCIMNIMPMMMLTLPTIFPTVEALGFNLIWFGVICVITMEMGQITPPVGMNVITMASMYPEIPLGTMFRAIVPFFVGMLICIAIVVMFPQLALCLIN